MHHFSRVAIALGSNLGDRLTYLQHARDLCRNIASPSHPFFSAPIYSTQPINCPPNSPDFLNTVLVFHTSLTPLDLLTKTQQIEISLGRHKLTTPNAPRVIDLDILFHGEHTLHTPQLTLPHPRLHLRHFVLQPLADILPDWILPLQTSTTSQLLSLLPPPQPPLAIIQNLW